MNDRPKVGVLVPAAGQGLRMGGSRKQFRELGTSPVLHHTVRLFDAHPHVDGIIIAVPPDIVAELRRDLAGLGLGKLLDVVAGGASRQASVELALSALPAWMDVVLVHDAVRPFLTPERISAVIDAVVEYGAAALAVPVTDTLREGTEGFLGETVPRSDLYRMQTPQGCRRDRFEQAFQMARKDGFQGTDDVALIRRAGHAVRIVKGMSTNIKITTADDWTLARALWESASTNESAGGSASDPTEAKTSAEAKRKKDDGGRAEETAGVDGERQEKPS